VHASSSPSPPVDAFDRYVSNEPETISARVVAGRRLAAPLVADADLLDNSSPSIGSAINSSPAPTNFEPNAVAGEANHILSIEPLFVFFLGQ
jgi:hypothetical protein